MFPSLIWQFYFNHNRSMIREKYIIFGFDIFFHFAFKFIKGNNIFSPKVKVLSNEFLDSDKKILVHKKLQDWLNNYILVNLKPISETIDNLISSEVRAFIFNIFDKLGTMEIKENLTKIDENKILNIKIIFLIS